MSRALPPLDLHAHVAPGVTPLALEQLGAVVFAATRSLDEFEQVRLRSDAITVWGVGCHPAVAAAQSSYDEERFASLMTETAFVSEVGLDGTARVAMDLQTHIFTSILAQTAKSPRLVSVHSKRATRRTLDIIEATGTGGVILHWWLGSGSETRRAVELGCLFSINRSMDVSRLAAAGVPLSSLLPETDHPRGNRTVHNSSQPGWTLDVEEATARTYATDAKAVRQEFWRTLTSEFDALGVAHLLPPVVQAMLAEARKNSPGSG